MHLKNRMRSSGTLLFFRVFPIVAPPLDDYLTKDGSFPKVEEGFGVNFIKTCYTRRTEQPGGYLTHFSEVLPFGEMLSRYKRSAG